MTDFPFGLPVALRVSCQRCQLWSLYPHPSNPRYDYDQHLLCHQCRRPLDTHVFTPYLCDHKSIRTTN